MKRMGTVALAVVTMLLSLSLVGCGLIPTSSTNTSSSQQPSGKWRGISPSDTSSGKAFSEEDLLGIWKIDSDLMGFQIIYDTTVGATTVALEFQSDHTLLVLIEMEGKIWWSDPIYYWTFADGSFEIVRDGKPVTLHFSSDSLTGSFSLNGDSLTLTLDSGAIVMFSRQPASFKSSYSGNSNANSGSNPNSSNPSNGSNSNGSNEGHDGNRPTGIAW